MKSNEGVVILLNDLKANRRETRHDHLHTIDRENDNHNQIVGLKMFDIGNEPSSG